MAFGERKNGYRSKFMQLELHNKARSSKKPCRLRFSPDKSMYCISKNLDPIRNHASAKPV
jgi:hypothetical protein